MAHTNTQATGAVAQTEARPVVEPAQAAPQAPDASAMAAQLEQLLAALADAGALTDAMASLAKRNAAVMATVAEKAGLQVKAEAERKARVERRLPALRALDNALTGAATSDEYLAELANDEDRYAQVVSALRGVQDASSNPAQGSKRRSQPHAGSGSGDSTPRGARTEADDKAAVRANAFTAFRTLAYAAVKAAHGTVPATMDELARLTGSPSGYYAMGKLAVHSEKANAAAFALLPERGQMAFAEGLINCPDAERRAACAEALGIVIRPSA